MEKAIVLTCFQEKHLKKEMMTVDHCFVRVLSGEVKIIHADTTQVFGPGDTLLFPRGQLSTIIESPKDNQPYQCVLIMFTSERLQDYYSRHQPHENKVHIPHLKSFSKHPLLESYFASLLPYFDLQDELPEKLLNLKIEEALTILKTIDKSVDVFLADFSDPGKIDLAAFMEQHYMYNMPLDKFSYLTGRSLTTFKRDFNKIYGTTPQRWLTSKRLKLAHYLLSEKKQKPVDAYREAGFENLSHFSYAFKKHFGYAPSHL